MAPQLGKTIGDFTFLKPDGTPVHLHDYRGKPLLLIFLRHLA